MMPHIYTSLNNFGWCYLFKGAHFPGVKYSLLLLITCIVFSCNKPFVCRSKLYLISLFCPHPPDGEQLLKSLTLVTKVAYGHTDQHFAVSGGTLHDHGKG